MDGKPGPEPLSRRELVESKGTRDTRNDLDRIYRARESGAALRLRLDPEPTGYRGSIAVGLSDELRNPMNNREDIGKLVLRVALAGILLFHGVFKLTHGVAWMERPLAAFGLPGFLAYGTYVAEVLGPLLLLLGYKARLAALVIIFDMLMAMVLVLRPQLLSVKQGGGGWAVELEALILLTALAVFLLGSGRYRLGRGAWD